MKSFDRRRDVRGSSYSTGAKDEAHSTRRCLDDRHSHPFVRALIGALLTVSVVSAHAGMLGSVGPTYPIAEENAVTTIMKMLREKARTGELKRLQEESVRRSMASIKQPTPVAGIRTATSHSERTIDPSVTYETPLTTDDGRVIVPAGTRINPLDVMPFTETLVFFDGRDPEQTAAVGRMLAVPGVHMKAILVAGSWLDLTKQFGKQIYFDQRGVLAQRFGIDTVPAVIRQKGKVLSLTIVPAKELK